MKPGVTTHGLGIVRMVLPDKRRHLDAYLSVGESTTITMLLKRIKPKRISDQVLDQLRELIFRGELAPGQKIMPERELAESLGVSRASVRHAINRLVVMGLVEQKHGQGTFVRSQPPASENPFLLALESQNASLKDLVEVRMGFECHAAALAAERADRDDLEFIEKSLEEMKSEIDSGRLGENADTSFHMAVSYASKNPLQIYIMKIFFDYLFASIRENLVMLYKNEKTTKEVLAQHTKVFQAIRDHSPKAAYDAMQEHIQYVIDHFNKLEEY